MLYKKARVFNGLPFRDKLFFLRVVMLLSFSKLVILFIPLKRIAPHLGRLNENIRIELTPKETKIADRVKLFIYMAGSNVPWRSVCLDQALTCMLLLNRYKIPCSLYLGVRKNEALKKLDAHAWVVAGKEILVGGERSRKYHVVAWFSKDY